MSTQTETGIETGLFVDGRFVEAVGGTTVLDEFTETRWLTVQRGSHPFPF